jgi:hypothetical protein
MKRSRRTKRRNVQGGRERHKKMNMNVFAVMSTGKD